MVLVDTSVWVSHLRRGVSLLETLLEDGEVLCHPFIIGELACGKIQNRKEIISLLRALPTAMTAGQEEVLRFIETHRLMGVGLGLIDVHLLASAFLSGASLWSMDRDLQTAAERLKIRFR